MVYDDGDGFVCGLGDGKVSKHDGRLICAAPDMYAALNALRTQALQSNVADPANEWGREALELANAALAKAEGRHD
jgi:hypothetical protein